MAVDGGVKLTPMLAQYLRLKERHRDAILMFRLGDFYEMFFEDAERAAAILDITLTARNKHDATPIPLCGRGVPNWRINSRATSTGNPATTSPRFTRTARPNSRRRATPPSG